MLHLVLDEFWVYFVLFLIFIKTYFFHVSRTYMFHFYNHWKRQKTRVFQEAVKKGKEWNVNSIMTRLWCFYQGLISVTLTSVYQFWTHLFWASKIKGEEPIYKPILPLKTFMERWWPLGLPLEPPVGQCLLFNSY